MKRTQTRGAGGPRTLRKDFTGKEALEDSKWNKPCGHLGKGLLGRAMPW